MTTILIADDDPHIREVVRYALEREGFAVIEAADGQQALDLLHQPAPTLAILDIVMPNLDGLSVCRELRKTSALPVVFLTSKSDEIDRVVGLELGADDYLAKPFSPRELVARVRAILRRIQPISASPPDGLVRLTHHKIILDSESHQCFAGKKRIDLTVTEFSLLRALIERPNKVFTRDQLMDRAWGADTVITDRTIDSHVRRIRRKFEEVGEDCLIETIHGLGYKIKS